MVRVTRFSPPDPDTEKAIRGLNEVLVGTEVTKQPQKCQNASGILSNQALAEDVEQHAKEPLQAMATAAETLGSITVDTAQLTMSVSDPSAWASAMNGFSMIPIGLAGQQLVSTS